MSTVTNVSLPKTFDTGKASEWFQRFEICRYANGRDNDKMALKLPTPLEGEALAIWLELTKEVQKDYTATKKKIIDAIKPMSFISLDNFHKRVLHPGELLSLYVHELKQLLNQAMPGISTQTMEQLLLHQFLTGLPHEESRPKRCYTCNKVGHLQYNCPTRQDPRFCFTCGQQGHGWRTCPQGNSQGVTAWGSGHPRP